MILDENIEDIIELALLNQRVDAEYYLRRYIANLHKHKNDLRDSSGSCECCDSDSYYCSCSVSRRDKANEVEETIFKLECLINSNKIKCA